MIVNGYKFFVQEGDVLSIAHHLLPSIKNIQEIQEIEGLDKLVHLRALHIDSYGLSSMLGLEKLDLSLSLKPA